MFEQVEKKKFSILAFIIIISCVFLQYRALVVSYGMLLLFAVIVMSLIFKREIIYDKQFLALSLLLCSQQILSSLILKYGAEHLLSNCIFILFAFIISGVGSLIIEKENIIKSVQAVAIICSFFVLFQAVEVYIGGKTVDAIKILPLSKEITASWYSNGTQPCGLFSEPQTFCSYMSPLLVVLINRKKSKAAIFLSFAMLLTGSSLGISLVVIVWLLALISRDLSMSQKVGLIILGVISVFLIMSSADLLYMVAKITDIFKNFSNILSGKLEGEYSYGNYYRIVKGWQTFFDMPLLDRIIGIGKDSFSIYYNSSNIHFSWSSLVANKDYYSSAAGNFIEYGLIGGLFFYVYWVKKWKTGGIIERQIVYILLFSSFFTQISYNGVFIYYILILYLFHEPTNSFRIRCGT